MILLQILTTLKNLRLDLMIKKKKERQKNLSFYIHIKKKMLLYLSILLYALKNFLHENTHSLIIEMYKKFFELGTNSITT